MKPPSDPFHHAGAPPTFHQSGGHSYRPADPWQQPQPCPSNFQAPPPMVPVGGPSLGSPLRPPPMYYRQPPSPSTGGSWQQQQPWSGPPPPASSFVNLAAQQQFGGPPPQSAGSNYSNQQQQHRPPLAGGPPRQHSSMGSESSALPPRHQQDMKNNFVPPATFTRPADGLMMQQGGTSGHLGDSPPLSTSGPWGRGGGGPVQQSEGDDPFSSWGVRPAERKEEDGGSIRQHHHDEHPQREPHYPQQHVEPHRQEQVEGSAAAVGFGESILNHPQNVRPDEEFAQATGEDPRKSVTPPETASSSMMRDTINVLATESTEATPPEASANVPATSKDPADILKALGIVTRSRRTSRHTTGALTSPNPPPDPPAAAALATSQQRQTPRESDRDDDDTRPSAAVASGSAVPRQTAPQDDSSFAQKAVRGEGGASPLFRGPELSKATGGGMVRVTTDSSRQASSHRDSGGNLSHVSSHHGGQSGIGSGASAMTVNDAVNFFNTLNATPEPPAAAFDVLNHHGGGHDAPEGQSFFQSDTVRANIGQAEGGSMAYPDDDPYGIFSGGMAAGSVQQEQALGGEHHNGTMEDRRSAAGSSGARGGAALQVQPTPPYGGKGGSPVVHSTSAVVAIGAATLLGGEDDLTQEQCHEAQQHSAGMNILDGFMQPPGDDGAGLDDLYRDSIAGVVAAPHQETVDVGLLGEPDQHQHELPQAPHLLHEAYEMNEHTLLNGGAEGDDEGTFALKGQHDSPSPVFANNHQVTDNNNSHVVDASPSDPYGRLPPDEEIRQPPAVGFPVSSTNSHYVPGGVGGSQLSPGLVDVPLDGPSCPQGHTAAGATETSSHHQMAWQTPAPGWRPLMVPPEDLPSVGDESGRLLENSTSRDESPQISRPSGGGVARSGALSGGVLTVHDDDRGDRLAEASGEAEAKFLDKLTAGDGYEAMAEAVKGGLWGHAFALAHILGADVFNDVMKGFAASCVRNSANPRTQSAALLYRVAANDLTVLNTDPKGMHVPPVEAFLGSQKPLVRSFLSTFGGQNVSSAAPATHHHGPPMPGVPMGGPPVWGNTLGGQSGQAGSTVGWGTGGRYGGGSASRPWAAQAAIGHPGAVPLPPLPPPPRMSVQPPPVNVPRQPQTTTGGAGIAMITATHAVDNARGGAGEAPTGGDDEFPTVVPPGAAVAASEGTTTLFHHTAPQLGSRSSNQRSSGSGTRGDSVGDQLTLTRGVERKASGASGGSQRGGGDGQMPESLIVGAATWLGGIIAKAVKPEEREVGVENKFYFDEAAGKWRERGKEEEEHVQAPAAEAVGLPPPPPPPPKMGGGPPPPHQGSGRVAVRSRYVDIFAKEQTT